MEVLRATTGTVYAEKSGRALGKNAGPRAPSSSVLAWRIDDQAGRGGWQSRHGGS